MKYQEHMWDSQTGLRKLTQEVVDGAICKGCLRKQGGNWKTWRTRYFILTENVLFYLSSPKNAIPKGAILLANTLIEGADETIDKPFSFIIKSKKSYTGTTAWSGRTYYLQALDYADMNRWIQALLSNPVRLSQKITYAKLGQFARLYASAEASSTPSSRANTNTSIASNISNHTEKSGEGASGGLSSRSAPTHTNRTTTTDADGNIVTQDGYEETLVGNEDLVEGLRLSECYTVESPSYMMQNYTSFSSSDESDCEDTPEVEGSYSLIDAPIATKVVTSENSIIVEDKHDI